jgi:hypothetical protein
VSQLLQAQRQRKSKPTTTNYCYIHMFAKVGTLFSQSVNLFLLLTTTLFAKKRKIATFILSKLIN